MSHLSADDIKAAREWAATRAGCTCPTTFDGDRYVVDRHTCPHCRAWHKHMTQLGVSAAPRPAEDKKPSKRKYGKAA